MKTKYQIVNEIRLSKHQSIRALAREMGLPEYVLRHVFSGRTKRLHEYHDAAVDAWLKAHESEIKRGK